MERVMVIIDGGYLNGLRRAHGTMVDMTMLKRYIQNTFGGHRRYSLVNFHKLQ